MGCLRLFKRQEQLVNETDREEKEGNGAIEESPEAWGLRPRLLRQSSF